MTDAQLAADPDAQRLRDLCGPNQLPVIPLLSWEYGGSNHAWIDPQNAALVYCVYTPVNPGNEHFNYDASTGETTADLYVLFPDQNPCKDVPGPDQVLACIGDPTDGSSSTMNVEILVDTINIDDGAQVGLDLSSSPTHVMLIQPDGTKILMYEAT